VSVHRNTSRLAGKVAVVTGAARGLGQALAVNLATEGAQIVGIDLNDMASTQHLVTAIGGTFSSYQWDVTQHERVPEGIDQIAQAHGRLDILINNAGIYPFVGVEQTSYELWRRVLALNLDAPFTLSAAAIPYLKRSGEGRIINIASNAPWLVAPGLASYIASKMGLIGLTRALATELAPFGITVNAIGPSLTKTPGSEETTPEIAFTMVPEQQAIHRLQQPEDVVGAVAFLASSDSAFMTGQTLMVDGGLVRL
jgi:NAD(P)-dependent dehydrogenase (short-subunit alcohol dehydrogenase family)